MRTLIFALGIAAIAATPALAQTGVARGTTSASGAGTTGTTATTNTTTASGRENVSSPAPSSTVQGTTSVAPGGASTGFGTNVTTDINAATPGSSFAEGGPFSNDSGNSALGTSAGQSSSGTLVGNSSPGIGADSSGLNTGAFGVGGAPVLVPEGNVSVIGGGTTGARVAGVPATTGQQAPLAASSTPLYDQVAREGAAKEARRRARGEEPRVYGIAPNTERDLTWQMPDDRIIRY